MIDGSCQTEVNIVEPLTAPRGGGGARRHSSCSNSRRCSCCPQVDKVISCRKNSKTSLNPCEPVPRHIWQRTSDADMETGSEQPHLKTTHLRHPGGCFSASSLPSCLHFSSNRRRKFESTHRIKTNMKRPEECSGPGSVLVWPLHQQLSVTTTFNPSVLETGGREVQQTTIFISERLRTIRTRVQNQRSEPGSRTRIQNQSDAADTRCSRRNFWCFDQVKFYFLVMKINQYVFVIRIFPH